MAPALNEQIRLFEAGAKGSNRKSRLIQAEALIPQAREPKSPRAKNKVPKSTHRNKAASEYRCHNLSIILRIGSWGPF